jgi:hypothetical protein
MADAAPFTWEIRVGGKALNIGALYADDIDAIEKSTGAEWGQFCVFGPLKDLSAATELVRLVAKRLEVEDKLPDRFTLEELYACFEKVPDDLPTGYVDGDPPKGGGGSTVG